MNLFPFRSIESTGSDELPLFIEFDWDFENDCNVIEDGELKKVSGNEALKIWAYKALRVQRYRYLSFSWQYGCENEDLIGKVMGANELEKVIEKYVEDALKSNPYILNVKDFEVEHIDDIPVVSFTMITVYGEVSVNV